MTSMIQKAIDLIVEFEGCRLRAYQCPAGIWTIGYGHTGGVADGDNCTQSQAESLLYVDLRVRLAQLQKVIKIRPDDNQMSALLSLVFNIGIGNFETSTLLEKLNAGDSFGASLEFERWNKVKGVVFDGLTRRRIAERDLFMEPIA